MNITTPLKSRERANVASPTNVGGFFDRRVIGGGLLSRRVTDWRVNAGKSGNSGRGRSQAVQTIFRAPICWAHCAAIFAISQLFVSVCLNFTKY